MQKTFEKADAQDQVNWHLHQIDSTIIRAHQHAAGARKTAPDEKPRTAKSLALGRSKGGFTTKVHLKVDGQGKPLGSVLTPGQAQDRPIFEQVMQQGKIKRQGRGRPKQNPKALAADKGYTAQRIRHYLNTRHIQDVIPTKSNQRPRPNFDQQLYKERNHVERAFNFFKQARRLATRYDKLPEIFSAFWFIASIIMWL